MGCFWNEWSWSPFAISSIGNQDWVDLDMDQDSLLIL